MVLLSGLIGAAIGALLTLWFNLWKFNRDERNARCDELCAAIRDVGSLASDYWAKTFDGDAPAQKISEARVYAAQILVEGLAADFTHYLPINSQKEIEGLLSEFVDTLTGDTFSVEGRDLDFVRLERAPQQASMLIVTLRRLYRASMPLHQMIYSFHANKRRTLDMPATWASDSIR
jgi:hypothetical protein